MRKQSRCRYHLRALVPILPKQLIACVPQSAKNGFYEITSSSAEWGPAKSIKSFVTAREYCKLLALIGALSCPNVICSEKTCFEACMAQAWPAKKLNCAGHAHLAVNTRQ